MKRLLLIIPAVMLLASASLVAQATIATGPHDLSAGSGVRTADLGGQTCVFCHTPHGAATGATPLWNRKVAGAGYTQSYVLYDSNTLDAKQVQGSLDQPGGSSKLCGAPWPAGRICCPGIH